MVGTIIANEEGFIFEYQETRRDDENGIWKKARLRGQYKTFKACLHNFKIAINEVKASFGDTDSFIKKDS